MHLKQKFNKQHLILASGSPRRQQFLRDLGLDFEVRLKPVKESFPQDLTTGVEIAEYLAELKTQPYQNALKTDDILITGDTIVWYANRVLHKPKNKDEAFTLLSELSGKAHQVISATCIMNPDKKVLLHGSTTVYFTSLSREEIEFYIDNFQPYDKAGAYAIQEWIGKIGIKKIEGSYYNVMGMPINQVYAALKKF